MRITSNSEELLQSLIRYKEEVTRKLTAAVVTFSYYAVLITAEHTPLGDETRFQKWYARRAKETGLRPEEGLAQGGWQANTSGAFSFRQTYGRGSSGDAANDAEDHMRSSYKLGDTVWIGNTGPYIMNLQNNSSPQTEGHGIVVPSESDIVSMYSADFKSMYDNA